MFIVVYNKYPQHGEAVTPGPDQDCSLEVAHKSARDPRSFAFNRVFQSHATHEMVSVYLL